MIDTDTIQISMVHCSMCGAAACLTTGKFQPGAICCLACWDNAEGERQAKLIERLEQIHADGGANFGFAEDCRERWGRELTTAEVNTPGFGRNRP